MKSCGEVETIGKHPSRMKSVSTRWLFERLPGFKRKTRNEFEEEFGRKVRNIMGNSRGELEKAVQKWSSEMQTAIQPEERRREARERTTMEKEDSNSQRQRTWEKLRPITTGLTVSSGAWGEFAMCASH